MKAKNKKRRLSMTIIISVSVLIFCFVIFLSRFMYLSHATKGEVIYIKQEYGSNIIDILISGGRLRAGSQGAELSKQLNITSTVIFSKLRSDAFSVKELEEYLIEKNVDTLYIVGADASGCVYKTALGGMNRGYQVTILRDCIFSVNEKIYHAMCEKYREEGMTVIDLDSFMESESYDS